MKKIIVLFFLIAIPILQIKAQVIKTTTWTYATSKNEVKVGEEVDLVFNAKIQADWYMYSNDFDPDLGPQITEFNFTPNTSYQLVGKARPINPKKKFDKVWEGEISYFTETAQFIQTIKVLDKNLKIGGAIVYQTCTDKSGKCIPYEDDFSFTTIKVLSSDNEKASIKEDGKKEDEKKKDKAVDSVSEKTESKVKNNNQVANKEAEVQTETKDELVTSSEDDNLLWFIGKAMLGGFLALLMPCIFPMIPMTVTFFTKQSKTRAEGVRKALVYGSSIVLIFIILGILVSFLYGADFNNWLSTHWAPNLFFFGLLVMFALSFLGMFELVLPSSFVNKIDQQSDKGGYYGVFFMAFTLALVSFSCTAPIVGTILVEASQGSFFRPIIGMFAFSATLAIPFTLFAIFPSWLQTLPKSGGWLNSIKVVLGFLELALALKFFSQADLVYHWRILDREVFLALWIVLFSLIGFYLIGKIQMPHDSKLEKIPVPRMILAIISFAFVVYMIPGMFGAPLKVLSGYLPPQNTLDFDLYTNQSVNTTQTSNSDFPQVKYSELLSLPHNLKGFFDYEEALAYAKKVNKPIFIDFTGHACANCRDMEARVWSDKEVLKRLREDYVVLALYVDEKKELPESEWITGKDNKVKKTIGAKNAYFQIDKFNNNAQPFYCLLDHNGKLLVSPKAYDLNAGNFVDFLDEGVKNFEIKKISLKK